MLYPNFAVYVGEKSTDWQGYIVEHDFFIVLSANGLTKDEIVGILSNLDREIELQNIEKLEDFDVLILNMVREKNLPSGLSLAAGYLKDDVFLLKTINGKIYLRRGESFAKIIDGSKSASGHIQEEDSFIFCTNDFSENINEADLNKITRLNDIKRVTDEIERQNLSQEGSAIFVNFEKEILKTDENKRIVSLTETFKSDSVGLNKLSTFKEKIKLDRKKAIYILVALAILFLGRSLLVKSTNQVEAKKQEILGQLEQAEEVSSLNIETATELIAESEKDFAQLKKITKNKNIISEVETSIAQYKKKIFKSDVKEFVEYFDLSVEDKKAKGTIMYLVEDVVYILNPEGAIYEVSLTKKSIDKHADPKIKNATSVSSYEETIYFLKSDGVYSLVSGKSTRAIKKDDLWKKISELRGYAGNLYLLDKKVGNIFKYSPTEKGFSEGSIYIRPDPSVNLSDPVSFAIDGAVYVATQDNLYKFTNGYRDAFSFYIPEEIKTYKIYTDENLEFLYVWDKEKGKIYILNKEGSYLKQVKSEILKTAQDFVVFENNAFVFASPKIYKISL